MRNQEIAFNGAAAVRMIEQTGLWVERLHSTPTNKGHAFRAKAFDEDGEKRQVFGCQEFSGEIDFEVWPTEMEMFLGGAV